MARKALTSKMEVLPPNPSQKGSIALTKMSHIRSELSRLYREARNGKIDLGDATRLTYILQVLAKIIEGGELEQRIEALEAAQGDNNGRPR
ncbi:MAG: hypothetical protein PHG20_00140 [Geobacteraceae bacterium]|nr:hypothetical protein [Geobacteraceae bacterium]